MKGNLIFEPMEAVLGVEGCVHIVREEGTVLPGRRNGGFRLYGVADGYRSSLLYNKTMIRNPLPYSYALCPVHTKQVVKSSQTLWVGMLFKVTFLACILIVRK